MSQYPQVRYIDVRLADSSEQISLDLARHLPRRLAVGPAIIISDRPHALLPVLRKRWMRIIREVERQRSSTLNRVRKQAFEDELTRMRSLRFAVCNSKIKADVLVASPPDINATTLCNCTAYTTLYIATCLSEQQFNTILQHCAPQSLVVTYGQWEPYKQILCRVS